MYCFTAFTRQISNYEVGVIFLLKDEKDADRVACFQRPPKKYTSKDEPWVRNKSRIDTEGLSQKSFSFSRYRKSPSIIKRLNKRYSVHPNVL